jgi:hypothetical protein
MSDHKEEVLKRVAAGELTPEEALVLLDELDAPARVSTEKIVPEYGAPIHPAPGLQRLKVRSSYRSLEIVADPQVAQAMATGEHSVQLQDGVMVITTPGPLDSDSETPLFSFSTLPRTLNWIRSWRERQVRIRVNPAIPVELELTGVELTIAGLSGGLTARINASAVKVDQIAGAIDVQTFSSSLKGNVIIKGDSQFVCESSSVRLTLAAGSSARVEATGRMGRLSLPDDAGSGARDGETRRFSVGGGENLLTVESVMSSVAIDTPSWAKSA